MEKAFICACSVRQRQCVVSLVQLRVWMEYGEGNVAVNLTRQGQGDCFVINQDGRCVVSPEERRAVGRTMQRCLDSLYAFRDLSL